MNSKSYTLDGIGEVVVRKHHQARRITIKLRPGQPPRVVIPQLMAFDRGFQFAIEKRDWIAEHLQIINDTTNRLIYNEERSFSSRLHTVRFVRCNIRCVQAVKADGGYEMRFPADTDFNSGRVQRQIE